MHSLAVLITRFDGPEAVVTVFVQMILIDLPLKCQLCFSAAPSRTASCEVCPLSRSSRCQIWTPTLSLTRSSSSTSSEFHYFSPFKLARPSTRAPAVAKVAESTVAAQSATITVQPLPRVAVHSPSPATLLYSNA